MAKKYLIVEEESSGAAGYLAIAAAIAVICFVLSYAHLLLAGGLGFCGFLIGRDIIDSNPIYKWQHKTAIFLTSIVLMGGLGYLGGQQISDHFKKSMESSPTEENKPETQKSPAAFKELSEPKAGPAVTEKKAN